MKTFDITVLGGGPRGVMLQQLKLHKMGKSCFTQ